MKRKTNPQAGSFEVDLAWRVQGGPLKPLEGASLVDKDMDPLGLWSTLMLSIGKISEHSTVVQMSELKQPRPVILKVIMLLMLTSREWGLFMFFS